MAFDGLFMHYLTTELKTMLSNVRIKKIRQPQSDIFSFSFYKQTEQYIRFSLNPAFPHVRITKKDLPLDEKSNLLSALKKHLENALITDIKQYKKDRVMIFYFSKFDSIFGYSDYQLIFETMGRVTNLILTQNGVIIDAYYKQFSPLHRSILVGSQFEFFHTDKLELIDDNNPLLLSAPSPKAIMDQFMGFSLQSATYLYNHKGTDIYQKPIKPTLYQQDKKVFSAFDIGLDNPIYFDSLSSLLEQLDQKMIIKDKSITQIIDKELKRLTLKQLNLQSDLDLNASYESFKHQADYIYMAGLDLNTKTSQLDDLKLDSQKTLNENAQALYHKYHRAKKAIEPIKGQMALTNALILYYQSLLDTLSYADKADIKDLQDELIERGLIKAQKTKQKNNKQQKPTVLSFVTDDFAIYIGKSSIQNDYLTHTFSQKTDYWFHVQQGPGAHVLLRGLFNEESLRLAAMLAAYFSPMRDSSSIAVDYTLIKYIKKIKGLPGYNVSYDHQKTMYIDIDMNRLQTSLPTYPFQRK